MNPGDHEVLRSIINPPDEQFEVAKREAIDAVEKADAFMVVVMNDQGDRMFENGGWFSTGPKVSLSELVYGVQFYWGTLGQEIAAHAAEIDGDEAA